MNRKLASTLAAAFGLSVAACSGADVGDEDFDDVQASEQSADKDTAGEIAGQQTQAEADRLALEAKCAELATAANIQLTGSAVAADNSCCW